ncbi:hypothetical protein E2C01_007607 [Portunus trituberculatus]|uniref:Uncharacterized protein n=1 Tax=Portunus trituberculatus TaxID=210409 RepID=A0A5B7D0W6_PORTR|nr:hypothetical protein [Portunus trituberculatus]
MTPNQLESCGEACHTNKHYTGFLPAMPPVALWTKPLTKSVRAQQYLDAESRTYFSKNSVTYLLERSSFSSGFWSPLPLLFLVDSSSLDASEVSETVVRVSEPGSE